jgi:uncharacterized protein with HEPN domain
MQRDLEAYVWDIARSIDQIERFVAGLSFDGFLADDMIQAAVERKFEIIGEAIKQASQHFPGRLDSLPSLSLYARFRDRLAHGYFNIQQQVVWESIEDDLPPLKKAVDALAATLPPPPEEDVQ